MGILHGGWLSTSIIHLQPASRSLRRHGVRLRGRKRAKISFMKNKVGVGGARQHKQQAVAIENCAGKVYIM